MGYILSELMLIFHFSLIFSLTVLCSILYFRTRDRVIFRFFSLLAPLFLYLLVTLIYYLYGEELNLFFGSATQGLSLFSLVFISFLIPFVIYGTTSYMLSLLEIGSRERKIGTAITRICSVILFLISLFIIIYLNGSNWRGALTRGLNELFLYSSLFLILPAIVATVFLKRSSERDNRRLLTDIMISFYPMPVYFTVDILFFRNLPYKMVYLSYSIFSLMIYFYISRHFFQRYEPAPDEKPLDLNDFFREKNISEREQEIIELLIQGVSNREMGETLYISYNTVKTHVRNIYRKLDVSNKLQLLYLLRHHRD
ncbi:LuxR family transcriptional regulator [Spirochaeta isovalerica]|uniref:DNA-binding CsgD family transcriptional regulator n=1 Tax=Spirochaeta isovalerica TaxID=150 RepID=A0A841RCC6_9SPIO|nr:LuxR family transcriptional regulator [Spirochaeta isovalerica]MBB6480529.1 DNA-binding CsgD family transcriptional regulator [Spirochaeta isovalerica]